MLRPIDTHAHPFTREAVEGYGLPFLNAARYFGRAKNSPLHPDPTNPIPIERSVEAFAECGLERVVMSNMDARTIFGSHVPNEVFLGWAREYPDMIKVFLGVDPHRGERGVEEMKRDLEREGAAGVKLHPSYQEFWPNDKRKAYPIYKVCSDLGVPVLFHSGDTRLYPTRMKYCRPLNYDDLGTDFPELKVILSHWAVPWVDEAIHVIWRNPNFYMDLAGILPRYYPRQVWHYTRMPEFRDRVLFGSDYPMLSPKVWLESFEGLREWNCPICEKTESWPEGLKEKILRGNAERLLGDLLG